LIVPESSAARLGGGETGGSGRLVPYEELGPVEQNADRVQAGGSLLAGFASVGAAREFSRFIVELVPLSRPERERRILARLGHHLDAREAARKLDEVRGAAWNAGIIAWTLSVWVLVISPLAAAIVGLATVWPLIVAGHLTLTGCAALSLRPLRTGVLGGPDRELWSLVLTMLLYPPAALRFAETATRDVLAAHHPLAVSLAVLEGSAREDAACIELARILHPSRAGSGAEDRDARQAREWFEAQLAALAQQAVIDAGLDPVPLLLPPRPDSPSTVSYCPRCRGLYTVAAAACGDCPGVALRPVAPPQEDPADGRNPDWVLSPRASS
jgi:hypothetical protein